MTLQQAHAPGRPAACRYRSKVVALKQGALPPQIVNDVADTPGTGAITVDGRP
jgi:hypothetical protein